jgi:hypothetical protein
LERHSREEASHGGDDSDDANALFHDSSDLLKTQWLEMLFGARQSAVAQVFAEPIDRDGDDDRDADDDAAVLLVQFQDQDAVRRKPAVGEEDCIWVSDQVLIQI